MATVKLHELLAAEGNLETQCEKVTTDLKNTFEKKRHLFEESRVVFTPNTENSASVTESQSDIQSTVKKELKWIQGHIEKALDAAYQIAETNTVARADIVLENETVLAEKVPVTSLLELEKQITKIQELVAAIPTLDPAKGYAADPHREPGIYKAREVQKVRTKKSQRVVTLYEATKEHPAQVQLVPEDVSVGTIFEQSWSALLTPSEKSEIIDRVEQVIRAIKRARSRANDQEVNVKNRIGGKLLKYIFG